MYCSVAEGFARAARFTLALRGCALSPLTDDSALVEGEGHLPTTVDCALSEDRSRITCSMEGCSASFISEECMRVRWPSKGLSECVISAPHRELPRLHGGSHVSTTLDCARSSQKKAALLVSGGRRGALSVCAVEAGEEPALLWAIAPSKETATPDVCCARLMPFGDLLCAGDAAGALHIFAVSQAGDQRAVTPAVSVDAAHLADVTSLAFLSEGRTILSGSADGTVRAWDAPSQRQTHCFGELSLDSIQRVREWDECTVLSLSGAGWLRICDVRASKVASEVRVCPHSGGLTDAVRSDPASLHSVAVSAMDGSVSVLDSRTLKVESTLRRDSAPVTALTDGLIAANSAGCAWKCSLSAQHTHEFTGHSRFGVSALCCLGDALFIADRSGRCFQHSVAPLSRSVDASAMSV